MAGKYAFTPAFELSVIRQVLNDPILGSRVLAHVDPERFASDEVKLMSEVAKDIFSKTSRSPSSTGVLQAVRGRIEAGAVKADAVMTCALALEAADEQPPVDSNYVQQVLLEEARASAVWNALDFGLKSYRRRDWDGIQDAITKATSIGRVDSSPGSSWQKTLAERTRMRRDGTGPRRQGTGLLELDDRILGGLAPGELGVILGAPKRGKSQFLGTVAVNTMQLGGQVVYFSLEMGEQEILDRIDAAITNVPISQLAEKADYVHTAAEDWYHETKGVLLVKQLPSYDTTAKDLEQHLQMLRAENGIEPTVVIVDSGDFMSSSEKQHQRHDLELGGVYSELRGLAVRWKVPMWTGSWAKRESLAKKEVTMADTAESWRKVGISDLGVAICGTEEEVQNGVLRLYVAWCRFTQGGFALGPYKNGFAYGRMLSGEGNGEAF